MAQQIEKRRHNRHETTKPVRVFPVLPSKSGYTYEVQNHHLAAQTIDISEGGAGLEISTRSLNPQSILKLNFETPSGESIEVYAKIIWSEKSRCGVRFIMSDRAVLKAVREITGDSSRKEKDPSAN